MPTLYINIFLSFCIEFGSVSGFFSAYPDPGGKCPDPYHWMLQVTYCNQSQEIIWGIGPQGYRCQNCDFDVHKKIVHQVSERLLKVFFLKYICEMRTGNPSLAMRILNDTPT